MRSGAALACGGASLLSNVEAVMAIMRLKKEAELWFALRADHPPAASLTFAARWDHNRWRPWCPRPRALPSMPYQLLADAVLALHVGLVVFVIGGFAAIVAGNLLGWGWANRLWWRAAHLAAIVIVAVEAWFGAACPVTILELRLRSLAGEPAYGESFVEHWLQRLLYYEAPAWVFVVAYSLFALAVVGAWWRWPPRRRRTGVR